MRLSERDGWQVEGWVAKQRDGWLRLEGWVAKSCTHCLYIMYFDKGGKGVNQIES